MSVSHPAPRVRTGRTLHIWTPEDKAFWEREGDAVAKINLWISVPALFLAFAIWQVWSVVAVSLPGLGFLYSSNQLFWLAAAPALSGATLRIFYSFMVPVFGGRRWTAISTASLLIPAIGIGYAVQDNTTTYPTMLVLALLCGLGGGNFSSSMANISFFFPKERKGSALGVNAGLGNLGVSVVQFLSPLVVTASIFGVFGGAGQTIIKNGVSVQVWTQNAAFIWVPWIALTSLAAWFGMHDIADAKACGYVSTLFGRRRALPELASSNFNVRSSGERMARNTPIQGTAADVIKLAMVRVWKRLRDEKMASRLILTVHDELIVEAPEAEAEQAAREGARP